MCLRGPIGGIDEIFDLDPVSFHWNITYKRKVQMYHIYTETFQFMLNMLSLSKPQYPPVRNLDVIKCFL